MIRLSKVTKSYGDNVVFKRLSYKIKDKEIVGITGKSGVGKTTLLRCLSDLEEIQSGTLEVNTDISYMFQEDRLCPWLTLYDNVLLPLKLQGKKITESVKEDIEMFSKMFAVEGELDKKINEVSGGQRQRILLIRAMITKPRVLLLDEPFKSLDDKLYNQIIPKFLAYCRAKNLTILIASHNKKVLKRCDKVLNLNI